MAQRPRDPRWLMRWFTLLTFLLTIPVSVIMALILTYQTKSLIPIALPGSLLLAMRPIIRFLFPPARK